MSPKVRYKAFQSTRHFGVEMEVNEKIDRNTMGKLVESGDPSRPVQVTHGWTMTIGGNQGGVPTQSWSVKTDSTCCTVISPGNYGHEVASPKMSGENDIKTVGNVAAALANGHCEVNHRCGVHVHVDIATWDRDQTGVMLAHWCRLEDVLAQSLPPHRRNNKYAKLMRKKHKINYAAVGTGEMLFEAMKPTNLEVHQNYEKRVAINLIGYTTGLENPEYGRRTAELRLPEGTLDRADVENWTRLYVHFIEECSNRKMCVPTPATLAETLVILGLAGDEEFFILSPELYETKVWFLKRILRHTNYPSLFSEVVDHLNRITEPLEKFVTHPAGGSLENAA